MLCISQLKGRSYKQKGGLNVNYRNLTAVYAVGLILSLSACTGTQVKRHIAEDLSRIVDLQDCPTVCEQLQLYLNTKLLGVSK